MAQLPPKIPNMSPSWSDFSHHQKMHSSFASFGLNSNVPNNAAAIANPSWVDEFLDFSTARRGSHRRSVSDSITFLEAPMLDECRGTGGVPAGVPVSGGNNNHEFDRFDDEQFLSMFNDEISMGVAPTVSSSNPSTPSDHNSTNDEKETQPDHDPNKHQHHHHHHHHHHQQQLKNESDEVDSQCDSETQGANNAAATNAYNDRTNIDPKRVKRILANRQSAQRSRVRKLQYISELERSVTSLQAEISVLSPRVAFLDHQRLLLNVDNSALKQRIAALAQDKIFKDAHQEALKREIERLRQAYHQQSIKKMENATQPPTPTRDNIKASTEKEQLLNAS